MLKYKIIKVDSFELVKVSCNKCGTNIPIQMFDTGSGTNLKIYGGYSSKIVDALDTDKIEFTICDDCMIKFMKTFKIKVFPSR